MPPANRYGPMLKALDALAAFERSPWLTARQLADIIEVDPSTAHRMATALAGRGWLERDPESKRYRLGIKLWELGALALAGRDVRECARPYMERLVRLSDESVELGILDGADVVYIERVEGTKPVRVFARVGTRRPVHCLAMGKILLGNLPRERRTEHLKLPLERYTNTTITDVAELHAVCDEARKRGYAINIGEYHVETGGVAAPVFDHQGMCVAALSFDVPASRMDTCLIDKLAPIVVDAAALMSKDLGFKR